MGGRQGGQLPPKYEAATSNVPFLAMLSGAQGPVADAFASLAAEPAGRAARRPPLGGARNANNFSEPSHPASNCGPGPNYIVMGNPSLGFCSTLSSSTF